MKQILAIFIAVMIAGCGYKPVSKVARANLDDSVYVEVVISKTEPKNSVLIKDAVREGLIERLGLALASKEQAKTHIEVSTTSLRYSAMMYDEYGYISAYKANLGLNFKTRFKDGSVVNIPTTGEYDFSLTRRIKEVRYADSVISDTEKFEAIKQASKEAFDEYISILAIKGYKNGSN